MIEHLITEMDPKFKERKLKRKYVSFIKHKYQSDRKFIFGADIHYVYNLLCFNFQFYKTVYSVYIHII